MTPPPAQTYWLYLLECEGGVYYAGIALDVEQRFYQHLFGTGAKFTRARPPLRVLAAREYASKGEALRAELALKACARADKLGFFAGGERPHAGPPPAEEGVQGQSSIRSSNSMRSKATRARSRSSSVVRRS